MSNAIILNIFQSLLDTIHKSKMINIPLIVAISKYSSVKTTNNVKCYNFKMYFKVLDTIHNNKMINVPLFFAIS